MARFLHLSDLHVVPEGQLVSSQLDTARLLRLAIDTLTTRLDAIGPVDAVLVTGDISDDGSTESYEIARRDLMRLGHRLLVVPGNHDGRETFRAAFSDLPEMRPTGLIDWIADIGDTRVIGLDTLIEGKGGGVLRDESLALLSEALSTAGGRQTLVALHHPPLQTGLRFMDAIGLENPNALRIVLDQHDAPVRVLAGHVHGVYHGLLGRHPVVTAPSCCSAFALDLREDAPVGFMTGPTGCALIDTGAGGVWTELPLRHGEGPFRF
ncbi:MAG: serine/threonine protein phosphatase [Roseovarius sp. BRH_c41]|uniref:phosphodiesterase n=1 Tax=Roseovarius sp. BRH_c41 TaxID=1629709 RepID=UPI0005F16CF8|nr:phosphodiesterase [Roseovarius sp. BRH_c41]KJS44704.1 MAG: serine/threonine protein phosphatase [Roseovarius sp. BRH_c41]